VTRGLFNVDSLGCFPKELFFPVAGFPCSTPPLAQTTTVLISTSRHRPKPQIKQMAPKGKPADKGKGKGKAKPEEKEEKDSKGGKAKASQFINVRHILVLLLG
jgi:hypothetical protein